MPKRNLFFVLFLLLMCSTFVSCINAASKLPDALDFRAVWVSTVLNLDYPTKQTADAKTLKEEADKILDGAKEMGMNAIILQVRPSADSFYDSDYFPWSKYLTGTAGKAPGSGFDPLEYWVEEAHKRDLELHAWINPYRITKNSGTDRVTSVTGLTKDHPARLHPDWVIPHGGDLYFDPGLPEVRKLIVDSTVEIVKNYDVDGIHLDDYFYPATDFDDAKTYKKYGKDLSLDDWRRSNVDELIKALDEAVHKENKDISFGVSPFGIWANKSTISAGSDTRGGESYTQHYADTRKWVKLGYVDYIAPQIYWHIGHNLADYKTLVNWWADTVKGTDVDLYIGHAAYRVGAEGENKAWATPDELVRQIKLNCDLPEVKGSIYFRYKFFEDSDTLKETITNLYRTTVITNRKKGAYALAVTRPEADIETTLSSYYIGGSSDSNKPLYINGELILNRSEDGFFGLLVPLKDGENKIVCTQGGKTAVRTITKVKKVTSVLPKEDVATLSDISPAGNVYRKHGEKVTLSCVAPIGATVKVTVNGKTFTMSPKVKTAPDKKNIYNTTYTYSYTLPKGESGLKEIGAVSYSMTYKKVKETKTSEGKLYGYNDAEKLSATLKGDVVWGYYTSSTSGGSYGELDGTMTDNVTAIRGDFVRLASNLYVQMSDVVLSVKKTENLAVKSAALKVLSDGTNILSVTHTGGSGWAKYDEDTKSLIFSVSPATDPKDVKLPEKSMFSSVSAEEKTDRVVYTLKLRDDACLGGWTCASKDDVTTLTVTQKRTVKSGAYPLTAHTIVIDAGHGGHDSGALGLLGSEMPEKDINLKNALALKTKLESLGAKVIMTRRDDTYLTLNERVCISRNANADLFISMHANSLSENSDVSTVSGFSVYYRDAISKNLAESMHNYVKDNIGIGDKGVHQSNLYVGRSTWCPAIIYEAAFMPNPSDFQWLISDESAEAIASTLTEAIVDYFRN